MSTPPVLEELPFTAAVRSADALATAALLLERYRQQPHPHPALQAADLLDAAVQRPMPGRDFFHRYFQKHPEVEALRFRIEFIERWELTGWRKESAEGISRDWDDDLEELYVQLHGETRLPGAILRWVADLGLEACLFRVSRAAVLPPAAG